MPPLNRPLAPWEIAARRRNAQSSTGPRTPAGKRRSALNSRWRSLCSELQERKLLARGEDPNEFRRLHGDLIALLRPTDPAFEDLVASLAVAWWQKLRLLRKGQGEVPKGAKLRLVDGRIEAGLGRLGSLVRLRTRLWYYRLQSIFGRFIYSSQDLRMRVESRLPAFHPFAELLPAKRHLEELAKLFKIGWIEGNGGEERT